MPSPPRAWRTASSSSAPYGSSRATERRPLGLPPRLSGVRRSANLVEVACLHVVDEAAHGVLLWNEGAGLDPRDRLTEVLPEIVERLRRPLRLDPRLPLDLMPELVVAEGQHPAVGVVDEHDLLGSEKPLRDGKG